MHYQQRHQILAILHFPGFIMDSFSANILKDLIIQTCTIYDTIIEELYRTYNIYTSISDNAALKHIPPWDILNLKESTT